VLANIKQLRSKGFTQPIGDQKAGFTLVELIISISVVGILSVSLLAIITNYFVLMTRNNTLIDMTADSQNLLRGTVEALRYGAGVRQTNTINDTNAPAGGWNTSNASFVIIIAMPATNASNDYIVDPDTGSPYNNELVYYKNGNLLFRRDLAHPSATGNTLKTSCPANIATNSCPADRQLIQNIDSMIFTLFDQDDASTTDPLLARSIKIDLSLKRDTFGEPLTLDNSIRITLRNTF